MTEGIRVEIRGLAEADEKLKKLIKRSPRLAAQALYTSALAQLVPYIRAQIRANDSVFTGQMFQRVAAKVSVESHNRIVVDVGVFGVPYAMAVEEGQLPGTTQDLEKLTRYARLKLGYSNLADATRVGYLLKRSIETNGSEAHPFLKPVILSRKAIFMADFEIRYRLAIRRAAEE